MKYCPACQILVSPSRSCVEPMGAPLGNQNGAKAKVWSAAIERALGKRSAISKLEAIDELAEQLLKACDKGDIAALRELGDRLDGKPAQQLIHSGDVENPVRIIASTLDESV